ncbi:MULTISPECIES: hypothetical protein [Paraburkholderia]|uniref:hypothetical protein n=1 Tax=Paraburkholderia TaxID=1822464 RepID=UPI002252EC31|nr:MULTISPECIES: hypothetical protein [Paraburkholderia]MCX4172962.1 hypothetical protein [Paraburkholderia madseniana]MDQ6460970.1 hypothetical protein [Paraburkholderia madseniana]
MLHYNGDFGHAQQDRLCNLRYQICSSLAQQSGRPFTEVAGLDAFFVVEGNGDRIDVA